MERFRDFDYLEDLNRRFYRVIGNHHPQGRVRVCLSYVPTSAKSEYRKEGQNYLKVSDEMGYLFTRDNFPELMYRNPFTEQQFIALPIQDIERVYSPRSVLEHITRSGTHPALNDFVSRLADYSINQTQIGIHGSVLLGLKEKVHDYDIVIYGIDNFHTYKENFPQLKKTGFKPINEEEIRGLAFSALRNHPVGLERMYAAKLARSSTVLLYKGFVFSIHFSYEEGEYESTPMQIGKSISLLTIKGILLDDSKSYFAPYAYLIQVDSEIYQVIAYSFAYFSVASEGDKVEVSGTLRDNNLITIDEPCHYIVPVI